MVTPRDILFECPACGKSLVVDDVAQGMTVECPQCHIRGCLEIRFQDLGVS
jgi:transcription elongation factor Elf1